MLATAPPSFGRWPTLVAFPKIAKTQRRVAYRDRLPHNFTPSRAVGVAALPCPGGQVACRGRQRSSPARITDASQSGFFRQCFPRDDVLPTSGEIRCTCLVLQWIHALASVNGGGHFTRPSYLTVTCSVLFLSYRNLNTLGDDFRSCFRILGSTADTRAHASVYGFWGKLHVFPT